MDIMISFDVFEGISDQYFVEKNQTNFFAKKVVRNFHKGTPFGIGMKSNVTSKSCCHFKMSVCNYCKGSPLLNCHFFRNSKN